MNKESVHSKISLPRPCFRVAVSLYLRYTYQRLGDSSVNKVSQYNLSLDSQNSLKKGKHGSYVCNLILN